MIERRAASRSTKRPSGVRARWHAWWSGPRWRSNSSARSTRSRGSSREPTYPPIPHTSGPVEVLAHPELQVEPLPDREVVIGLAGCVLVEATQDGVAVEQAAVGQAVGGEDLAHHAPALAPEPDAGGRDEALLVLASAHGLGQLSRHPLPYRPLSEPVAALEPIGPLQRE